MNTREVNFQKRITTEYQERSGGTYDLLLRQDVTLTTYGPRVAYYRVAIGNAAAVNEIGLNWLDDLFPGRINRAFNSGEMDVTYVRHPHDEKYGDTQVQYPVLIVRLHRPQTSEQVVFGFNGDVFDEIL